SPVGTWRRFWGVDHGILWRAAESMDASASRGPLACRLAAVCCAFFSPAGAVIPAVQLLRRLAARSTERTRLWPSIQPRNPVNLKLASQSTHESKPGQI